MTQRRARQQRRAQTKAADDVLKLLEESLRKLLPPEIPEDPQQQGDTP